MSLEMGFSHNWKGYIGKLLFQNSSEAKDVAEQKQAFLFSPYLVVTMLAAKSVSIIGFAQSMRQRCLQVAHIQKQNTPDGLDQLKKYIFDCVMALLA